MSNNVLSEDELKALKTKVSELHNAEEKAKDKQIASNIAKWAKGQEIKDEDQEPDFETLSPEEKEKRIERDISKWSETKTPSYL